MNVDEQETWRDLEYKINEFLLLLSKSSGSRKFEGVCDGGENTWRVLRGVHINIFWLTPFCFNNLSLYIVLKIFSVELYDTIY